jgi:UDP-N-acetylmuramoylalanine--D-glutamate ligase
LRSAPRPPLPEGPYLIVGLARSGSAAARVLRARGAEVIGVDAGAPAGAEALVQEGVELHQGEDGRALLERVRTIVKSPGVPAHAPVVAAARAAGIPVLGEVELAWRLLGNEFVAVTGTNGKTTTVELIGHIHRAAGLPVAVAGNVGTPLSSLVGSSDGRATVVCEASSFQLEDTLAFAPEAAVLLNVTPDHLDRHGTLAAYREAKLRIFAHQAAGDVAVIPLAMAPDADRGGQSPAGAASGAGTGVAPDASVGAASGARTSAAPDASMGAAPDAGTGAASAHGTYGVPLGHRVRRVRFGEGANAECALHDGRLWWQGEPLLAAAEVRLRGGHNLQNALAAAAVCMARGVDRDAVRAGLRSFAGVPHRLQEVARRDGVLYVNDSKATNVASTRVALRAFPDGGVHLILGGQAKGQDFGPLRAAVAASCRAVYLIGEDAPRIAQALADIEVPLHEYGDLERAVAAAAAAAAPQEVVLLSPACASFDQFSDFEARGDMFTTLVARSEAGP